MQIVRILLAIHPGSLKTSREFRFIGIYSSEYMCVIKWDRAAVAPAVTCPMVNHIRGATFMIYAPMGEHLRARESNPPQIVPSPKIITRHRSDWKSSQADSTYRWSHHRKSELLLTLLNLSRFGVGCWFLYNYQRKPTTLHKLTTSWPRQRWEKKWLTPFWAHKRPRSTNGTFLWRSFNLESGGGLTAVV